jgi:hypothetical protein
MPCLLLKASLLAQYARSKGLKASVSVDNVDSKDMWTVTVKDAHKLKLAA